MAKRKISREASTKVKANFLSAVLHDDKKKINNFLKNGWDVNTRTGRTSSLLYLAFKQKNFSLIKFLINNGAEINGALQTVGPLQGYSMLQLASGDNDEKLVNYLIERGADVNFSADDGSQPIHAAVYFQQINITKILIENNADVNANYSEELYQKYLVNEELSSDCYEGVNLLTHAIIRQNYGLAKLLIENGGYSPTVLLRAIDSNSQEIIQLVMKNVSLLCKNNKLSDLINVAYPSGKFSGYTCLHLACKTKNPFSVLHLIQNGGNVNATAQDGVQPIHLAVLYPNVEIIKILLDHGAHIDALFRTHYYADFSKLSEWIHSNDITLLTHSILYGNADVVQLLLDYDVIQKTSNRFTKNIIFYAAASDNLEIIKLILENLGKIFGIINGRIKNYINIKYSQGNYSGYTPLHMACRNNNLPCVKFLIENGADVSAEASDGALPIHLAVMSRRNEEIIKLLLDNGASTEAKYQLNFLKKHINNPTLLDFNNNFTLLNYAIFVKDTELIEFLIENGAKIDPKNNLNKTTLMYAVENNLTSVVRLLLDTFGTRNINVRDNSDRTALHYVLESKRMKDYRFSMQDLSFNYSDKGDVTRILLNSGADVFAMINDDPKTLIAHSAAFRACPQVLNLVLARQLAIEKEMTSPLTYACIKVNLKTDFDDSCGHLKKDIVRNQINTSVQHCLKYIIKRRAIGYQVSEEHEAGMKEIIEHPKQRSLKTLIEEHTQVINNRVNLMKAKPILNTGLTCFDVFTKSVQELANFTRNHQVNRVVESIEYRTQLECFYNPFRYKWSLALTRRRFLDTFNRRQNEIIDFTLLPYDVMLIVFNYIDNNKDLNSFLLAFS